MDPALRLTGAMSVGLIGPLPPPAGGMANQTIALWAALTEAGASVDLVQTNAPYRPAWIGRVPVLRALFRLIPYTVALWRCAGRVDVLHVMANSGWAWHLFAAPAIWVGSLRGVPLLLNYHGGEAERFFERAMRWVRPALARAQRVAVPSAYLQRVFRNYGIEAVVIPNLVDLERFAHAKDDIDTRAPLCIVARNLEPIYDIANAIVAFALIRERYPRARLSVAGTGPQREELEGLVRRLELTDAVRFTGRLDAAQMAALYAEADLLLNPSMVDNAPVSLIEAMAAGVPIVSTDVGGIPDLVRDGTTALLVPARHPQAMADAALRLLDEPALAKALVEAGRLRAAEFGVERVRRLWVQAYAELLPAGEMVS